MSYDMNALESDQVFLGLTRPAMVFGVTYSWFLLNGFIWTLVFLNSKSVMFLILGMIGFHFVGMIVCSHEPRFAELIKAWAKTNTKSPNKLYHGGTSSYDLF